MTLQEQGVCNSMIKIIFMFKSGLRQISCLCAETNVIRIQNSIQFQSAHQCSFIGSLVQDVPKLSDQLEPNRRVRGKVLHINETTMIRVLARISLELTGTVLCCGLVLSLGALGEFRSGNRGIFLERLLKVQALVLD